jgi:hypothetical protein
LSGVTIRRPAFLSFVGNEKMTIFVSDQNLNYEEGNILLPVSITGAGSSS